jgi:hypothetical protein
MAATADKTEGRNPMQPIVFDENGTARFKANNIVRYLLDNGPNDLNKLTNIAYVFSADDWSQFAQLLGYSVSGFGDLPYAVQAIVEAADAEIERRMKDNGR